MNEENYEAESMGIGDVKSSPKKVYLPGEPLQEGEELVCDQSAYVMLHQVQTGSPCLSFDVIKDNLGNNRETYPLTAYIVSGTQASQAHLNSIIIMKLSNLHRTNNKRDDENSDDDDDGDDDEEDIKAPAMSASLIRHQGCINRIRTTNFCYKTLVASWSELGHVHIWDLDQQLLAVDNPELLKNYIKKNMASTVNPLFTFSGHQKEGFALDWNSLSPGVLASGDCRMDIHIWHPREGGNWAVDQRPLIGHKDSVEDVLWSPNEPTVMASCSMDKSIRIWDIRAPPSKACMLTNETAHDTDVNVIAWNRNEPFIVSGDEVGCLHIWDLRRFKDKTPVATFKHHTQPITSVSWHPTDSSVFASAGSDDQIALWDLAVEKDNEVLGEEIESLPPQLLFIHQGQSDIKEVHWHPQLPGVIISTAGNGFNIFRTISV